MTISLPPTTYVHVIRYHLLQSAVAYAEPQQTERYMTKQLPIHFQQILKNVQPITEGEPLLQSERFHNESVLMRFSYSHGAQIPTNFCEVKN